MGALTERLTTSEAAVAAGVSVPQIHRIIDEKILPEDLYSTTQMRTFRTEACVLIAFYFETADSLTAQARLRTIRNAMAHCSTWEEWRTCHIEDHSLTVHFGGIWKAVDERLRQLTKARQMVIGDPENPERNACHQGYPNPRLRHCSLVRIRNFRGANSQVLSKPEEVADRTRLSLRKSSPCQGPAEARRQARQCQNDRYENKTAQLLYTRMNACSNS